MKFSEKIIQARKAKALTQEDLAEAVGVSRQAVSKWETEEAKPDLDKLVAICSVLDLSMDYLCLDKEPVAAAEPVAEPVKVGGKRYLLIGVCIGLVAAILVGLLGMALTGANNEPTVPEQPQTSSKAPTTTATTEPDYSDMLTKVRVFDVKYDFISARKWHISFVPSLEVPGMLVKIAVHDNLIDKTWYPETSKMGTSYVIDYNLPEHAFSYDFIAMLTVGDVTVQLPLLHAEGDGGTGTKWVETWKE